VATKPRNRNAQDALTQAVIRSVIQSKHQL
jgi:hypothetical protein